MFGIIVDAFSELRDEKVCEKLIFTTIRKMFKLELIIKTNSQNERFVKIMNSVGILKISNSMT